jgi:hypothetical protein
MLPLTENDDVINPRPFCHDDRTAIVDPVFASQRAGSGSRHYVRFGS